MTVNLILVLLVLQHFQISFKLARTCFWYNRTRAKKALMAGAYPGFCGMKQLKVLLLLLDGMMTTPVGQQKVEVKHFRLRHKLMMKKAVSHILMRMQKTFTIPSFIIRTCQFNFEHLILFMQNKIMTIMITLDLFTVILVCHAKRHCLF